MQITKNKVGLTVQITKKNKVALWVQITKDKVGLTVQITKKK